MDTHPNCQCVPEPALVAQPFPPGLRSSEVEALHAEFRAAQIVEPEIDGVPVLANSYYGVTQRARAGTATAEELAGFDAAIAFPLPEEVVAYRGISPELLEGLKAGDEIADAGYTFVSLNSRWAQGFAGEGNPLLRMRLPAGERVFLGKAREAEMVLARGGRYRIVKVGRFYIDVEVVR
jgi:hypothetical protein